MEKQQVAGRQKWLSDTSREWCRKVEGFREHIAIDGSLKGSVRTGRDMWMGVGSARPRQGRRAVVRYLWREVGGTGTAENDRKSSVVGFHHGILSGLIVHLPSIRTACASSMAFGEVKRDELGWAYAHMCRYIGTKVNVACCRAKNTGCQKRRS